MILKKSLSFVAIALILFSTLPASALETQNGNVIAGDLLYSYDREHGYYTITDTVSGTDIDFTFVMTGTYNDNSFIRTPDDFTWNSPSVSGEVVTLTESTSSWSTEVDFSSGNGKFTNIITNNYPNSITDGKFWYAIRVDEGDTISTPAGMHIVSEDDNLHWSNPSITEIKMRGMTFNFQDLYDNNFDITDIYLRDGDILGYPNQKIIAVGFTKGIGTLASGQTVVIDPVIEDGFSGSKSETSYNVNVTDTSFEATENGTLTITLDGVPDGVEIDETDSSTYPEHDYLVGLYPFETNYSDYSVNGNDGIATNVSIVDGTAILNGIDSKIQLSSSDFDFSNEFTIHAKLSAQDVSGSDAYIISKEYYEGYVVGFNENHLRFVTKTTGYNNINSVTTLENNSEYDVMITFTANESGDIYIDALRDITSSLNTGNLADTPAFDLWLGYSIIGGGKYTAVNFSEIEFWNISLSSSDAVHLETGYSGTSAKLGNGEWQPVINGTVTFDNVVKGQEITFLSPETTIADSLTTLYEYTEDVILIEESETENNVLVEINQTSQHNATGGSIEYDIASLNFTYLPVLDSTNENASVSLTDGTLTINTGPITTGDTFLYNISLSKIVDFTYELLYTSQYTFTMSNNSAPDYIFTIVANDLTEGHTYNLLNDTGTVLDTNSTIVDGSTTFYSALPDGNYIIQDATAGTAPSSTSLEASEVSASSGTISTESTTQVPITNNQYYVWSIIFLLGLLFFISGISDTNPKIKRKPSVLTGVILLALAGTVLDILPDQIQEIVNYVLEYINNAA